MNRMGIAVAVAGLLIACGCERTPKDPSLLARVGAVRIVIGDLTALENKLETQEEGGNGRLGKRDLLQALVDRQVLLMEARARGLEEDEGVLERLGRYEKKILIDAMLRQQVDARFSLSPEEVQQEFERRGWEDQIKCLEIFLSREEKVREVLAKLQEGESFEELGRLYAEDRLMKIPTGTPRLATYAPPDRPRKLVEAIFELPEGGVTEPIPVGDGYIIGKVVERRRVELEEVEGRVVESLIRLKKEALRDAYFISLKDRFKLEVNPEGMDLLVRLLKGEETLEGLEEVQRNLPVYAYDGGLLDVGEALSELSGMDARMEIDGRRAAGQLRDGALPRRLMELDARLQGVDKSAEFGQLMRRKKEDLMISRLRFLILDEKLIVSEEEIQARYLETRERFRISASARVRELLVETAAQAQELRRRIEEGEEMGELIAKHSIRQNAKAGMLLVYEVQAARFGEAWMGAVMNGPLGELQGPIRTKGGYSLFEVLERQPVDYYTLENRRVQEAIIGDIKRMKQREIFADFLAELHGKYADRIEIYADNLERWATAEEEQ